MRGRDERREGVRGRRKRRKRDLGREERWKAKERVRKGKWEGGKDGRYNVQYGFDFLR